MSLTITASERDALYQQILDRMSGVGDIWLAIDSGNFESAEILGREFIDDFTLVSEDLGWGESSAETVQLTTSPGILRRALNRHCELALRRDANEALDRQELRLAKEQNESVVQACRQVLADLNEGPRARA